MQEGQLSPRLSGLGNYCEKADRRGLASPGTEALLGGHSQRVSSSSRQAASVENKLRNLGAQTQGHQEKVSTTARRVTSTML